jgi:hypothetical protein
MSRVIVSVATGPRFCGGMRRLKEKLDMLPNGAGAVTDFWYDRFPPGPTHDEIPYGFKVSAIEKARADGHDAVLWLDSSIVPIRPLDPVWKLIESQGYWFSQNYDYTLGQFCSDGALRIMQLEREEALAIPLVIGTAFGLNFAHNVGRTFFYMWKRKMEEGAFNGPWTGGSGDPRVYGHRHDQTVASGACHYLNMHLTQPPKVIVEPFQQPTEETVFTICR